MELTLNKFLVVDVYSAVPFHLEFFFSDLIRYMLALQCIIKFRVDYKELKRQRELESLRGNDMFLVADVTCWTK